MNYTLVHGGKFVLKSRPSYIIDNSPQTLPQFLSGIVHFFVASNVAKYNAFKSAVSLGNTESVKRKVFRLNRFPTARALLFKALFRYAGIRVTQLF